MEMQSWWRELFSIIDGRQTQAFISYLSEEAMFRYGSNPEVHGRAAIATVVDQVLGTFRASAHQLERCWEVGNCRIGQGIVTYTRLDQKKVTMPFCNVLTMRGDRVARYEIFRPLEGFFVPLLRVARTVGSGSPRACIGPAPRHSGWARPRASPSSAPAPRPDGVAASRAAPAHRGPSRTAGRRRPNLRRKRSSLQSKPVRPPMPY